MTKRDTDRIRPYGDHWDDGKIQLSFTLPVAVGEKTREAARLYLERLGLQKVEICTVEPVGEGFSFIVAYGCARHEIRLSEIQTTKAAHPFLPFDDLVRLAQEKIRRRIVVVGATTGTDAHTVGIDAILSIKGVAGDKGLEYYPIFRVINLRAQVSNEELVRGAAEAKADAILVSKLVTQQDQHLKDLRELSKMLRGDARFSKHLLKIVGGPRIDDRVAKSIGFDAGYGPGTKPSEVANFIVHELIRRDLGETTHRMEGKGEGSSRSKRRSLFGWLSGRGQDS